MRVDAVDGLAAAVEPGAKAVDGSLQLRVVLYRTKKHAAQLIDIGRQGVKCPRILTGLVHAKPQLRCKTGGANLRGAVAQRVHQVLLPARGVCIRISRQQGGQCINLRLCD